MPHDHSPPTVTPEFIRRAVELADLDAVRVTLYQHTEDPEVASLPRAAQLDDAQRARLVDLAVDWLADNARTGMPPEPPAAKLRELMNLATTEQMGDLEFEARRELPAFKPFPLMVDWTDERPDLPDDYQVAIIGSGFSGLAMGVQLELLGIPYVIIERRPEPGGTWSVNRYPDIRVDTISITYEFAFEKEYRWSEYFGRGNEVRSYLEHVARKYGPYDHTRFGCEVTRAVFDADTDRWTVEFDGPDGPETLNANVVVNGVGTFANPNHPDLDGSDEFEGQILHPARWPDDLDLSGKRVAIMGNGSTGVQLLSPIAAEAEQVSVFQRTPQWISPREKYGDPVEPEIAWLLDHFPGYWNWWRYMAIAALFGTHGYIQPDEEWVAAGGKVNEMNDQLRDFLTNYIQTETDGRSDLVDRLIPEYAPFSRRPVVDNGWYRALTRDNVELVTEPIRGLTPTGIVSEDGTERDIDVLVTATGFEVMRYLWPADYVGADGTSIHDAWSEDGPRAYLGMMVPNYPNMFMLYGPNSQPLSGGTGLPVWYVVWAAYSAQCIVAMIEGGHSRVEVTTEAYERYNRDLDAEAAGLLLMRPEGAPEKNYYINEHGRMQVNAPWYGPEYHRLCTEIDWDDLTLS